MRIEVEDINNTPLSVAWHQDQGKYSEEFAKKILIFEKNQKLKFESVLDICCGSGNLLYVMYINGKECFGTETEDDFINFDKTHYNNIEFFKTNSLFDFGIIRKFDLITCSNAVLNNLSSIGEWQKFLKNVYRYLNDGGIFFCDYLTVNKLKNWNEFSYFEKDNYDYLKNITTESNESKMTNIYYLKSNLSQDNKFKRVEKSDKLFAFENGQILNEFKNAKFRYVITTDENLVPIKSLENSERAYIIAIKRES